MNKTRLSLYILLALTASTTIFAVLHLPNGTDDKRKATLELMMSGLKNMHYSPLNYDDTLSERVYKMYLKRLDSKDFFTKGDMEEIQKYEYKISDELKVGTFEFYDLVNSIYTKRRGEDSNYTKSVLATPMNFSVDENVQLDPYKMSYSKDTVELHDQWRRFLKYQVMVSLAEALNNQEKAKEKKDTSVKIKTFEENEKDARKKELDGARKAWTAFAKETDQDRLSFYLNCITNAFDPHTEYFAPADRKNFDITMSGQLEGIGAQLQEKNGNITIARVVPGSPTWKNGEIKEGDIIIKVAQATGDPVDVQGMRIDDAIQLIRGKKGTVVRITIKKPDNSIKVVTLVRDIIHLEDTYAHDAMIDEDGKKIGYIRLPEFYTNYDGTGSRTCYSDVKQLLKELNAAGAQGLVMDLRDNGGGSLQDVVKMVGLFISTGPIVQVKGQDKNAQMMSDNDTSIVFSGPLVVLVNGGSASASEIFAAAIQDYKRGIIMGTQTYGKGTVQQMFNLDDYISPQFKDLTPLGSVKITISKFYRINGGTTQKDGVTPDIPMPDAYQFLYPKEKDEDCPINSDKIQRVPYNYWPNPPEISKLQNDFDQRTENDSIFQLIHDEAIKYKKRHDKTLYSLNIDQYRKEEKQQTEEDKKFESINKPVPGAVILSADGKPETTKQIDVGENKTPQLATNSYSIYPIGQEATKMKSDSSEAKSENTRLKQITKDYELFQATQVLNEMK